MTSVSSSWDGLYIRSRAFQGARSEEAYKRGDFGGLSQADWLKARGADVNALVAYAKTGLANPNSSLSLVTKNLFDARIAETTPLDQLPQNLRDQFNRLSWSEINASPAAVLARVFPQGAALFDNLTGSVASGISSFLGGTIAHMIVQPANDNAPDTCYQAA